MCYRLTRRLWHQSIRRRQRALRKRLARRQGRDQQATQHRSSCCIRRQRGHQRPSSLHQRWQRHRAQQRCHRQCRRHLRSMRVLRRQPPLRLRLRWQEAPLVAAQRVGCLLRRRLPRRVLRALSAAEKALLHPSPPNCTTFFAPRYVSCSLSYRPHIRSLHAFEQSCSRSRNCLQCRVSGLLHTSQLLPEP